MDFPIYEAVFKAEPKISNVNIINKVLEKAYKDKIFQGKLDEKTIREILVSRNSYITTQIDRFETRIIKKIQKYRNENLLYDLKEKFNMKEDFVDYFQSFDVEDIEKFILDNAYLLARFDIKLQSIQKIIEIDDNNKPIYDVLKEICNASEAGHAFIYKEELNKKINVEYNDSLNKMVEEKIVFVDENRIYLKEIYDVERSLIMNLKQRVDSKVEIEEANIENKIKDFIQLNDNFKMSDEQEKAIYNVFRNKLSIVTGPAGSGKSTLVAKMIECINYIYDGIKNIKVVAYTGKAVSRLNNEHMNIEAKTIHSCLGLSEEFNLFNYKINKDLKNTDYLIVDESSMLDVVLLNLLLTSVREDTNIIFVGDTYQLQPIGIGQPFQDSIESNLVARNHLNNIYRYKENTSIHNNADAIKNEQIDNIEYDEKFSFIEIKKSKEILENIKIQRELLLTNGYRDEDIVIISAINETIDNINKSISEELSKELTHNNDKFNVGDKVIQVKNDYRSSIFNGQSGVVTSIVNINDNFELTADFNGKVIVYDRKQLKNLKLAYALTIHKVQGSEFKVVIIILDKDNLDIFNNNLLYVAVTRAREKVIILGDKNSFYNIIKKHNIKRNSIILEQLLK